MRRNFWLQSGIHNRRTVEATRRQKRQEVAHILERCRLGLHHLVNVAVSSLCVSAAEFIEGNLLAGHVLDDIGASDKHVTLVAHRHHEVSLDRRIYCSTSAFAHNQ